MHVAKEQIPVKITAPGATARQQCDFGEATGYGTMSGEYFSLPAGMDISPLLQGLENDLCQVPHWAMSYKAELSQRMPMARKK
ncbi:hypothetical protein Q8A64_14420 [Oxalobacteraceae bacterium R-40]|uniref:Uncharacterized protein n=1 Tax=Keguizhuia sedimenti TaxID=3064264 RepID=A0ABU1BUD9_9BURK|nr:hypothetical protein [Oxalobacteraceae bacterium R-40]